MITKRQYFTILIIFLTIFLLFQGLQVGKSYYVESDVNKYFSDVTLGEDSARKPGDLTALSSASDGSVAGSVLFVGDEDGDYAAAVREWSYYTGRAVLVCNTLGEIGGVGVTGSENLPAMILAEPGKIAGNTALIDSYLEKGCDFVFLALPDAAAIKKNDELKSILGIHKIRSESTALHGIRLFSGFLLGGERIFEVTEDGEDAEKMQDLTLDLPWYTVRNGTETFVQGVLGEAELKKALSSGLKNEDMPAVVWQNHRKNGEVFAVNSDFMKNKSIAAGMLEAICFQRGDHDLYPVINAQVFSLANFPMLTDENNDQVEKVYGQSITKSESDIIMPMLMSLSAQYGVKPSCYLAVKVDGADKAEPKAGQLEYFLDMFPEMDAELCLSTLGRGTSLSERLTLDRSFFVAEGRTYPIASAVSADEGAEAAAALSNAGWNDVRTVALSGGDDDLPLVGYINETTTYQKVTSMLDSHTFTDELELLGVQTLLAYSHSYYDVENTFRPETEDDEWNRASQRVFSNLTTYNAPFKAMDKLTLTESDSRVRSFLALSYTEKREGDTVSLHAKGFDGAAYFILRTHNEEIVSVDGGDFTRIENGAYLITAKEADVTIKLSSSLEKIVDMKGDGR